MQSKVIDSLSKIQNLMSTKLQNTNKKFNVLRESDTDAVLEFMNKENPSKSKDRISGMGYRLGEPSSTLQNNSTFDKSQGFGEGSYITERLPMRSSRAKKQNKMVISMTLDTSTRQRSKSRSVSKSKKGVSLIGQSYRQKSTSRSKSRSVTKKRQQPFGAGSTLATIDEPAAKIFNKRDMHKSRSPKATQGPKIVRLKKKQRRTVIRHDPDFMGDVNIDDSFIENGKNQPAQEQEDQPTDIYDRPIMTK